MYYFDQLNKTLDQHLDGGLKNMFSSVLPQFSCFFHFQLFGVKNVEKSDFTSVWNMQHPNASQNIQETRNNWKSPKQQRIFFFSKSEGFMRKCPKRFVGKVFVSVMKIFFNFLYNRSDLYSRFSFLPRGSLCNGLILQDQTLLVFGAQLFSLFSSLPITAKA